FDNSLPALPAPADLAAVAESDKTLPPVTQPAPGQQTFPEQPVQGPLKLRPVPYQQHGTVSVDRASGKVTATMTNTGSKAVSMQVFPDAFRPFTATPNTVSKGSPKTFTWDSTTTGGRYAFSIYGPDRFVRRFSGTVIPDGQDAGQVPNVTARLVTGRPRTLMITLANEGRTQVRYTLTPNDYEGHQQTRTVGFQQRVVINWPTNQYGYYDVIITAGTSDPFSYRFAGRIT
ncbi:MAG: DUF756 domain-containing protein, partial [Actinobacteria bacterium]|nr:DUF756 domain-containing protein [Actinomycetota bacterium]